MLLVHPLFSRSQVTMPASTKALDSQQSRPRDDSSPPMEEVEKTADIRMDGGIVAWLQVLGAFCLSFTTW